MWGTFMLKDLEPPESLGERQPLLRALRTVPLVSSPTTPSQSPRAGDQGRRSGLETRTGDQDWGPEPGTRSSVVALQSPWACLPRLGSLPVSRWARSQVPEKLTCSPMSWGWFPTGTLVMPGRSIRVRSGTSGEVMSTLMSSWLMLTPFPAKVFWAAEAEAGGKPRVQINNPSKEKPRAPGA